jgi:ABC-2 type transport system ATP-binding protein
MIVVEGLRKRYGATVAVDDLSFSVVPGRVTGFLGPNGSGKSTTMRCMLGLDRAESGRVTFDGRQFQDLERPAAEVAALLDAGYVHPGRRGRDHLRWIARAGGVPVQRVDEVLEMVGMASVGRKRVKGYSLGMRQRLGLAGVLLGNPHTILLDEPANGLDPEGVRWIRDLLVHLAGEGRTVLVSSHLLAEMSLMAQDLIVVGRGRLVAQSTVAEFIAAHAHTWVRVRSPQLPTLLGDAERAGGRVERIALTDGTTDPDGAAIHGLAAAAVGELAAVAGVVLHELSEQTDSLEDAYLAATAGKEQFSASRGALNTLPPSDSQEASS